MRYLPKDLLGYLPRPIARLISTYIDFDELAFATYFHRTKKTEIEFNSIGIWRWKFQVRSWPSVQIDLKKSYQSTETNTGRFDRKLFLYDIHPDVAIKLIALLDLILHNNDEYLAIDCDCQK